jgi:hypothetical protein
VKTQPGIKPIVTSRLVWVSFNFSLFLYGLVLVQMNRATFIDVPENYTSLELIALGMGPLILLTLGFHEKLIKPETDMKKRIPLYIVGWILNEVIAIIAFTAVVTSNTGNGFVYLMNTLLVLAANLIMYPREAVAPKPV